MTRPRVYTLAEAAKRCGVSTWTVRSWMRPDRAQPDRPPLRPVPGSLETLGYHLFDEPSLVAAERGRSGSRARRVAHRASLGRAPSVTC